MKTAATLIHAFALLFCLSAHLAMSRDVAMSGVRRALQTMDTPRVPHAPDGPAFEVAPT